MEILSFELFISLLPLWNQKIMAGGLALALQDSSIFVLVFSTWFIGLLGWGHVGFVRTSTSMSFEVSIEASGVICSALHLYGPSSDVLIFNMCKVS